MKLECLLVFINLLIKNPRVFLPPSPTLSGICITVVRRASSPLTHFSGAQLHFHLKHFKIHSTLSFLLRVYIRSPMEPLNCVPFTALLQASLQ